MDHLTGRAAGGALVKLYLIDGTYELFRLHYAVPAASGPDGEPVGAARGVLRTLAALLRDVGDAYVACAFDHGVESFRNELFEGYKTSEGIEPELLGQFPLAEEAAEALGMVTWPMVDFEADDALATAVCRFAGSRRLEQVVICSPDKDLMQCVQGERVVCYDRMRQRTYDEPAVAGKLGVGPCSIPDYLALVGDTADGIPGLPGWGAKSTAAVLACYTHLEAIPDDPSQWEVAVRGASRLARILRDRRDEALLYRRLATLRPDAPLAETLPELRYRGPELERLRRYCERVGDPGTYERMAAAPRR